jgi:putative ABC transport system permease protein
MTTLRYALRGLLKAPGFTVVAILTLALGIGANTAIFSVVNGVLLEPLPVDHPEQLVILMGHSRGRESQWFSPLNFRDLTSSAKTLSGVAAYTPTRVNLTGSGEPRRLDALDVSWDFFQVLGASPAKGRAFSASDEASGAPATTVVISYALWQQQFGGRPDIINSTIRIDGTPCTIVGVAPANLEAPVAVDLWRPLIFSPRDLAPNNRGAQWISVLARVRDGATLDQANAELANTSARLAREYPKNNEGWSVSAMPLHEHLVGDSRPALLMLLGAVGLVLLIACVNVANLFFARAIAREGEIAVRAALGASRARLLGQLLGESVLLGLLGGGAGLLLALWGTDWLVRLGAADLPQLQGVHVDARVLLFTLVISIGAGMLFGLIPALHVSRTDPGARLKSSSRTVAGSRHRAQRLLVAIELALALVLLAGAGLLIRSFIALEGVNPGFNPSDVLTLQVSLPQSRYGQPARIHDFFDRLLSALRTTPGASDASAVFGLPMGEYNSMSSFRLLDRPSPEGADREPMARLRVATPHYFHTLGIPLDRGRDFTAQDDADHAGVVIINEAARRQYWPDEDPIGQRVHIGVNMSDGKNVDEREIVGIIGDVRSRGLDTAATPEMFVPHAQMPVDTMAVVIRTKGDPETAAPLAIESVHRLDPDLPVSNVRTMDQVIGSSVAARRFEMALLALFAGLALTLAFIGIYGVLSYAVTQRRQEIGVRMAIGADRGAVLGMVVRDGLRLTAVGIGAGLIGALLLTRLLTSFLYGVSPADPLTLIAAALLLTVAALAASYLPARRAAGVEPVVALRNE